MYFIKQKKKHIRIFCALLLLMITFSTETNLSAHSRYFFSSASGQRFRGDNEWWAYNGREEIRVATVIHDNDFKNHIPCIYAVYRVGSARTVHVNTCSWSAGGAESRSYFDGEWSEHSDRHPNSSWYELTGAFRR